VFSPTGLAAMAALFDGLEPLAVDEIEGREAIVPPVLI